LQGGESRAVPAGRQPLPGRLPGRQRLRGPARAGEGQVQVQVTTGGQLRAAPGAALRRAAPAGAASSRLALAGRGEPDGVAEIGERRRQVPLERGQPAPLQERPDAFPG
ncbi:MAG TPA: hypothetical protein VHF26_05450, partial [Trebonia sp.]|nr:hypothetical protein [Trebonia sp.]